ncbi:TRYpsin-like protease [Caenorhabditis elegans]|uniref:TRYpsin-like protease n=1 Tax=Caenorhabditis elegans TaxID=6239 RepID=O62231_CAEEL|nr:Protein kinase domain-containing protein [Caenorhabditis elegans]CAB04288.2 Protein kinase domain-containing protein [Caenorhabditis elegans]|eukprot:NP_492987.2 Uncharacterized protein CELE_F35E2.9 [Caenorhabditis elegans]
MNIKVIVIFFALTGCIGCDFYKLTADENKDRASTCGKEVLERKGNETTPANVSQTDWTLKMHNIDHNPDRYYLATMISTRHVLTSARLVRNESGWRDGSRDECDGKNLVVPPSLLEKVEIPQHAQDGSKSVSNSTRCKITAAYILDGCASSYPMLTAGPLIATIDYSSQSNISVPCLAQEENLMNVSEIGDLYFIDDSYKLKHSKTTINHTYSLFYKTSIPTVFKSRHDYGILTNVVDNKMTVMAFAASDDQNTFYTMSFLYKSLCEPTGICSLPPGELVTTTTTTTPNSKPTDKFVKLTSEENEKRLETCGNEKMERKATNDTPVEVGSVNWLVTAQSTTTDHIFSATMISSRHLLFPVELNNSRNNQPTYQCDDSKRHLFIPQSNLSNFDFNLPVCDQNNQGSSVMCPPKPTKLTSGYILDGCVNSTISEPKILIGTIENVYPANTSFPCLADENSIKRSDSGFDAYFFSHSIWMHKNITVNMSTSGSLFKDPNSKLYGTSTKIVNDKETVFGIGLTGKFAVKIAYYNDVICTLAGICRQFSNDTQFPLYSNDPSSISNSTTLSFNSTQPSITSSTSPPKPLKNITPEDVEETDKDVEATTEDDGNIDNDLVVSMDFLDGVGHKIGIIELVLILIGILLSQ